ncbi:DUF742 domain-containing protein [Streptomyces gamaensis]|uniref:DUF742 domain-containing protein n=1 Tax=Streptomyces gamaensis TaxID=1763542 RepID=A0ABW0ZD59_9ACTN
MPPGTGRPPAAGSAPGRGPGKGRHRKAAADGDVWYDAAAGPVVRPYAMTRGRTAGPAAAGLDLIALVVADTDLAARAATDPALAPEHLDIVDRAGRAPQAVADLAAALDLPPGVVRVLVADLIAARLVRVVRPVPPAELPDESLLRDVIHGLRAL